MDLEAQGNSNSRWTAEEERIIADLRKKKVTAKEIAKKIGRTPGATRQRMKKMGLARLAYAAWKPEEETKLKDLCREGYSWGEIAQRLNRTKVACIGKYNQVRASDGTDDPENVVPSVRKVFEPGDTLQTSSGSTLEFIRTIKNNRMHIFRHSAGFVETFTDQQLI